MELPKDFVSRTKPLLNDEWEVFEQALQTESPVSIRLNPAKIFPNEKLEILNLAYEPVSWASHAFYLEERPVFTLDPLFHAGCYYVQEASSMYLEQIVNQYIKTPVKCLDLCAAPGGKSTHLLSILPEGSHLTANEVIRSRVSILSENIVKWGYPNVRVTNNDPKDFGRLSESFDVLLIDAPCSGEGMFRKDAKAGREWSINNVQLCAERQKRILADCWNSLKSNGLLIYSTCTYNREENEENIEWICRRLGAEIVEAPKRFWPHRTKGEGFCISILRKTGNSPAANLRPGVSSNKRHARSDNQPQHDSVMSIKPSNDFPCWDVDKSTALNYLRREALINIPSELPKGYVIITYKNHPLGFVKNIGTRANNLYPQGWRIRVL
ncbi:MAG: rRNA cytosine-C5-methyltransferase [Candidatus Symbiothrix sp.]|jgi:16S rRNA C967 or C1407 C5-methylase (RsmB/RsmF family)|nr:rRNA cytosine-C5-methyltransferase [Candidatus Symbiothrix sp.]